MKTLISLLMLVVVFATPGCLVGHRSYQNGSDLYAVPALGSVGNGNARVLPLAPGSYGSCSPASYYQDAGYDNNGEYCQDDTGYCQGNNGNYSNGAYCPVTPQVYVRVGNRLFLRPVINGRSHGRPYGKSSGKSWRSH